MAVLGAIGGLDQVFWLVGKPAEMGVGTEALGVILAQLRFFGVPFPMQGPEFRGDLPQPLEGVGTRAFRAVFTVGLPPMSGLEDVSAEL